VPPEVSHRPRLEGRLEEVESVALRSFRGGINPSGILVQALNHALLLRRLASARLEGDRSAIRAERLFFRRIDRIKAQSAKWERSNALESAGNPRNCPGSGPPDAALEETVTIRALWAAALASRRR